MISNNLENKKNSRTSDFGELTRRTTNDGSLSLHSHHFNELFHSCNGARTEAEEKFIYPSQVNNFAAKSTINVLDVCFGMGYNTACLLEETIINSIVLYWWGLEIDKRPITISLQNSNFRSSWSSSVIKLLDSINEFGSWEDMSSKGKILWGDARQKIAAIPQSIKFDIIFHDAFSPQSCPELWSDEFLKKLAQRLAPNGRLVTYCSAAAIRKSLKESGLTLHSLKPIKAQQGKWSNGTIAINQLSDIKQLETKNTSIPLSAMEEEHLLTSAAIPYRDPTGKSSSKEILIKRKKEQEKSTLKNSSSWRKRWGLTSSH